MSTVIDVTVIILISLGSSFPPSPGSRSNLRRALDGVRFGAIVGCTGDLAHYGPVRAFGFVIGAIYLALAASEIIDRRLARPRKMRL
jgi:hypothetical protein